MIIDFALKYLFFVDQLQATFFDITGVGLNGML